MTDISLKEAFDIYQKQSEGLHKLWAYFQVVSLAVLGYTLGTDKSQWGNGTYLFVGLSYVFFAVANQIVIVVSQEELANFGKGVTAAAKSSGTIGKELKVSSIRPRAVAFFHTVSAVIVLVAITATWVDKCSGQKVCPKPESSTKAAA